MTEEKFQNRWIFGLGSHHSSFLLKKTKKYWSFSDCIVSNPILASLDINFYCSVFQTIQPVCQPIMRRATQECPIRTSLDLELDLQASRTRQNRLNDELQALRDLKQKLEEMKGRGETDLPLCVLEDERFQKLLKQAEKQVRAAYRYRVNE